MSIFSKQPWYIKYPLVIILGGAFFYLYLLLFINLPFTSPWKYVMMAFFVPIYSIAFMPILTLLGTADYKSELLFVTKDANKNYAIHFGSLFDCLFSGLFSGKRGKFKDLMLYFLIDGMLTIIYDIESGKIGAKAEISGSSYFFNENTAKKFGFSSMKLLKSHKYILIANYLEILLVFSFSKGRFSLPNLEGFKSVRTTGAEMLHHKNYIESLHKKLLKRVRLD